MDWKQTRELFPITRNYNFQNHAAVCPVCRPAAEAMQRYLTHATENAYVGGGFYRQADKVRQLCGQLIGANADEITFVKNTSEGISFVANGLRWSHGDNVIIPKVEFPANVYPWMGLQARGVQLRMVMEENGCIPLSRIVENIDGHTRVVAISAVQYASGYRVDLKELGRICQEKGVLLCVDAIQALGAVPIDVKELNIDFLSADGHKWLCAPEGCGIFYCRKELQKHLTPSCVGWTCMKGKDDYEHFNYEFLEDARRFDSGSYNVAGVYALGGAVEMLLDIGIERIAGRLRALTDRLVQGARDKGYRIVGPRQDGESSGIVAFVSDVHDQEKLRKHLQVEHRLVISVRSGRLRASPHFYNSEEEIDQLIDVLPRH